MSAERLCIRESDPHGVCGHPASMHERSRPQIVPGYGFRDGEPGPCNAPRTVEGLSCVCYRFHPFHFERWRAAACSACPENYGQKDTKP